jgi:hypothetical protein
MKSALERIDQQNQELEKTNTFFKELELNKRKDNQRDEVWKHYYTYYYVSSYGRVYSFSRGKGKLLKPGKGSNGYKIVVINKSITVHKVVAHAFHGVRPKDKVIDHINQNRSDNRAINLRYVTYSTNSKNRTVKGGIYTQFRPNGSVSYEVYFQVLNHDNSVTRHTKCFINNRPAAEAYLAQLQIQHAR